MLKVENLDLHYGAAQALRKISLEAKIGEVTTVLGRNGVEKIHELPLDTEARIAMQKTVGAIQKDVEALRQLGLM